MKTIRETLVERDNISEEEANTLILAAKIQFDKYLIEGDLDSADEICEEYFGLEQDYIMDLV